MMGATPSRLMSDPPHTSHILTPDAVPATTLPIYRGLGQAAIMLVCIPRALVSFDMLVVWIIVLILAFVLCQLPAGCPHGICRHFEYSGSDFQIFCPAGGTAVKFGMEESSLPYILPQILMGYMAILCVLQQLRSAYNF